MSEENKSGLTMYKIGGLEVGRKFCINHKTDYFGLGWLMSKIEYFSKPEEIGIKTEVWPFV